MKLNFTHTSSIRIYSCCGFINKRKKLAVSGLALPTPVPNYYTCDGLRKDASFCCQVGPVRWVAYISLGKSHEPKAFLLCVLKDDVVHEAYDCTLAQSKAYWWLFGGREGTFFIGEKKEANNLHFPKTPLDPCSVSHWLTQTLLLSWYVMNLFPKPLMIFLPHSCVLLPPMNIYGVTVRLSNWRN